ncbi:MAG TPA: DUF2760 domain-containing protein [Pirellulales bacterium]|jgi:hypothetical protein|nr:DUF2760 domain-containing protein [Pirellulales bacterium]
MSRLGTALRSFFRVLMDVELAGQVARVLAGERLLDKPAAAAEKPSSPSKPVPAKPVRSEAVSLLAALQREGRLVDFLQEPIAAYSDAQIGAAVRDVHRQCQGVLERMFALQPVVEAAEGSPVSVPAGPGAARFKLVGNVTGEPPFQGKLCHHGWLATRCELPEWTGGAEAAKVVAPAEVEIG